LVAPAGDSAVVTGVRAVNGRVVGGRGGTLNLEVQSLEPAIGGAADRRLRLLPGRGDLVEVWRFSVLKPGQGVVSGAALVIVLVAAYVAHMLYRD
jgi:hypothetical protein